MNTKDNSRIYRWIAALIGIAVAVFFVWFFFDIVLYILIAAVLSLIGKPVVHLLCKVKIGNWSPPKWLAALITLCAILALTIGSARLLVPLVIEKANQLAEINTDALTRSLATPIADLEHAVNSFLPDNSFSLETSLQNLLADLVDPQSIRDSIASVTTVLVDIAIAIFSISFILFFFLKDENLFLDGLVVVFPERYEENIRRAFNTSTLLLVRYFIGICIESLIKFACITLALWAIGLELSTATIIGLISAVLNVIPYVGPLIGALFGFAIAAVDPATGTQIGGLLLQMGVVFVVFQLLDNVILQPYIYASSVKAHPLEIFLVILMAGYIAGITGMLFAIPAYTVLRVFAKEFFNNFRVVQKLTENI